MALDSRTLKAATRHLRRADRVLAGVIEGVGPCRYRTDPRGGPFASLVESILYQQLNGKAAETIHGRLLALVGRKFPRPQDFACVSDAQLRAVGLSRQKTSYIRDLVRHAQDGLPLARVARMSDERVIETLTAVKGIGRWTAEMYLMFRLGRLDVLPVDDYGVRKSMQLAYGFRSLPKPERMRKVAESWRPYRSVACWYLWRSLDARAKAEPR
jgi:DNA-3-methyladenine glycosylase II